MTHRCPLPGSTLHLWQHVHRHVRPAAITSSLSTFPALPQAAISRRTLPGCSLRFVATGESASEVSTTTKVHRAANLLPHQPILENFVHTNPLSTFEGLGFNTAIEHVRQLESYMSPGERTFYLARVDPRKRVNEALVELSSVFLDRGAAKWAPGFRIRGFLYFFASLEGLGSAAWREHAREAAAEVLAELEKRPGEGVAIAEGIIGENLKFFGVPADEEVSAIRAQLMELRGWAGMFLRMEGAPHEAPGQAAVRLLDFCAVQSILARASATALAQEAHWDPATPFARWLRQAPKIREAGEEGGGEHGSSLAVMDQTWGRREALEREFDATLLSSIGHDIDKPSGRSRPTLQVFTCIDDREGSLRRSLEQSPGIETFGVAGFFGIPLLYRPLDTPGEVKLAPDGALATAVLAERAAAGEGERARVFNTRRRQLGVLQQRWEEASFSPVGSMLLAGALLPVSALRLLLLGFHPLLKHAAYQRFLAAYLPPPRTEFELPLSAEEAAQLIARTLHVVGMERGFAPVVVVLGHTASSVNNPFAAAYNCGACSGRDGSPNARVLARLVNEPAVRASLRDQHGIRVPDDTLFVAGRHDTTADTVTLYDLHLVPASHKDAVAAASSVLEVACGKNALERCHRFLLAGPLSTPLQALDHVRWRATDPAEARPELNHSTNAAVVVGRRALTRGTFLDRRVFLPSYDPWGDDERGTNLEAVLGPALQVCAGVNLEYLFSTAAPGQDIGAGSKAPLNVVGHVGVLQGTSGDLRAGLPSQMTEMHVPVRALFVVDAPIARVEAVLGRRAELARLVRNEWVRLLVRVPATGRFYRQSQGEYLPAELPAAAAPFVPFEAHRQHGLQVARREGWVYAAAMAGMLAACAGPVYAWAGAGLNPYGAVVAGSATGLSVGVLAFSRRYLHGEHMFGRFALLSSGLLLGFNVVATAPTLHVAMAGWSLFGFASTFLIGAYNDRVTVRDNATFAFAAYKLSDFAMLVAVTFAAPHAAAAGPGSAELVAGGLLAAALLKSSQWPLTSLFARSMEGPTPASALGYAGLSAHVGVLLLAGTTELWMDFVWARCLLGGIGVVTAVHGTLMAKTRAERKGALANATSATLGGIFVVLAAGQAEAALVLSLGHAAFRMRQILLAPNVIAEAEALRAALGTMPWPRTVPDWLYRLSWRLRRFEADNAQLLHLLHRLSTYLRPRRPWRLSKRHQWALTLLGVVVAGMPGTPLAGAVEALLMQLLPTHPVAAAAVMAVDWLVSVLVIRFLLLNVLKTSRFTPTKK